MDQAIIHVVAHDELVGAGWNSNVGTLGNPVPLGVSSTKVAPSPTAVLLLVFVEVDFTFVGAPIVGNA